MTGMHPYDRYDHFRFRSGHESAAVLLPGFGIKLKQNQVTRQPYLCNLTDMDYFQVKMVFPGDMITHHQAFNLIHMYLSP